MSWREFCSVFDVRNYRDLLKGKVMKKSVQQFHHAALAITFGVLASITAPGASAYLMDPVASDSSVATTLTPASITADFTWTEAPYSAWFSFSSTAIFDIIFASYVAPSASASDVSGFVLDSVDGGGATRLTNEEGACSGAPLPEVSGNCNFISATGSTSGNAAGAYKPGDTLISMQAPGSYRIGVYESGSPSSGSASFTIAVPTPASLALMLVALIGLGVSRRQ